MLLRPFINNAVMRKKCANCHICINSVYFDSLSMLRWDDSKRIKFHQLGSFRITSFNLLAPCYKREDGNDDGIRESDSHESWNKRLDDSLDFFNSDLSISSDVIAFQEFWVEPSYRLKYVEAGRDRDFEFHFMRRHKHRKSDALAVAVNSKKFSVMGSEQVFLCDFVDRVGLILWLYHRDSKKHVVVANTHLSYPHNDFDRQNQLLQIKKLSQAVIEFSAWNGVSMEATHIITGDFNVEVIIFLHMYNSLLNTAISPSLVLTRPTLLYVNICANSDIFPALMWCEKITPSVGFIHLYPIGRIRMMKSESTTYFSNLP